MIIALKERSRDGQPSFPAKRRVPVSARKFVLRRQSSKLVSRPVAALICGVLSATKSCRNDTSRGRPPARAARYVYLPALPLETINCLPRVLSDTETFEHPHHETRPDDPVPPKMGIQPYPESQEDVPGLGRKGPGKESGTRAGRSQSPTRTHEENPHGTGC